MKSSRISSRWMVASDFTGKESEKLNIFSKATQLEMAELGLGLRCK